jgi:hypothetical protein
MPPMSPIALTLVLCLAAPDDPPAAPPPKEKAAPPPEKVAAPSTAAPSTAAPASPPKEKSAPPRPVRPRPPTPEAEDLPDDDEDDLPEYRGPGAPVSAWERVTVTLIRAACYGLPSLAVTLWIFYLLLVNLAPDAGYRVQAWLGRWFGGGAIGREIRDLEGQLASRDLPHLRYKLGRAYWMAGRHRRAAEELAKVAAADAGHVDAHYLLGRSLLAMGKAAEAVAPLERAATLKDGHDYGGVDLALARARLATGKVPEAEALLKKALLVSPDLPEALYHLGACAAAQGRKDEAAALWRKCVDSVGSAPSSFRRQNREWLRRSRARLWFG